MMNFQSQSHSSNQIAESSSKYIQANINTNQPSMKPKSEIRFDMEEQKIVKITYLSGNISTESKQKLLYLQIPKSNSNLLYKNKFKYQSTKKIFKLFQSK